MSDEVAKSDEKVMSDKTVLKQLKSHPFVQGLDESYLDLLADCTELRSYNSGDYLLRYQKPAEEFLLLLEGKVLLLNNVPGKDITPLESIIAPNVIGWSWLVPPYRWHFDAKAQSPVSCLVVHSMCLKGKMDTDKEFGYEMYKRFFDVVVDRLQASRLQVLDVYAKPTASYL